MIDEHSSNPNLRKTIFEPETGIGRQHIYWTCTCVYHLSLGSSMVRAFYRLSEGYGFDPRLGLRNRFSEVMTWRTFISKFGQSLLVLQKCIIAVGKSKFWNLCCLGIIVCIWTMASLMSFPAVEIVSWFWSIFDLTSFKLSSWLNAELELVRWIGWFRTSWIVLDFSTTELIRPSFSVFCYCFCAPLGYSRAQCLCPLNCSYL